MAEDRVGREWAESAFSWIGISTRVRIHLTPGRYGTPLLGTFFSRRALNMLSEHPAGAECNDPIQSPAVRPRQLHEGKPHHGQVTGGAQRHWFPPVTVQAAPLPAAQVATRQTETRCNTRRLDGSWTQPSHHSTSAQPAHEHSPRTQSSHTCSHPADTRHRPLCA